MRIGSWVLEALRRPGTWVSATFMAAGFWWFVYRPAALSSGDAGTAREALALVFSGLQGLGVTLGVRATTEWQMRRTKPRSK